VSIYSSVIFSIWENVDCELFKQLNWIESCSLIIGGLLLMRTDSITMWSSLLWQERGLDDNIMISITILIGWLRLMGDWENHPSVSGSLILSFQLWMMYWSLRLGHPMFVVIVISLSWLSHNLMLWVSSFITEWDISEW